MDSERAHHNNSSGSSTGELFICFTSRFSSSSSTSSSMKISSKSILSPGRTDKLREPQISLSSSLSRRLRSNGSMKGGQSSPMFPAAGKKRGCAFENPEPSSPKVTCIGQVRVKTKKQGKKMRSRSKRRGEVSFRKLDHTAEGGRWVHLPLTICEALRAFGAEFNCFLPCASTSSCGAVFARWLVALQEGEKGREIELVVGEDERAMEGFQRRHVLDDIEIKLEEEWRLSPIGFGKTAPLQLDEVLEKCVSVEKIEEENSTVSEEKATLIEPTQLLEDHEEQEEEEDPAFPLDRRPSISSPPPPVPVHSEPESREDTAAEALAEEDEEEGATVEEKESEKSMVSEVEEEGTATHARPDPEQDQKAREPLKDEGGLKSNERETQPNLKGETTATTGAGAAVLPDCLLLMMCEPKLSMEVSKETWVNSADFIRWHPEKLVKPNNGQDQPKTRLSTDSNPTQQQLHQPPRSSCSFPAAAAAGASMATMIEQKFVNAAAYEPFVLTRCKSEPMRSSAKLASDACFWKNPKLEPHRPRVGAAGVGF
uniref:Uncharacterized protein n=1 Tax=Vitis vinifera TaxID=29760 RepID=F6H1Z7_VITVI